MIQYKVASFDAGIKNIKERNGKANHELSIMCGDNKIYDYSMNMMMKMT